MALSEEQKEIALRVAENAIIECDETWPSQQREHYRQIETFAEFEAGVKLEDGQKLYTEATIAQPASVPSAQKPIAWATTNEDGDYAMLFFDKQEARGYSGDDEPIGLAPVPSIAPQPEQENYKAQRDAGSQAAKDVLAERRRQIYAEGWTPEHDDRHTNGSLALAAATYAAHAAFGDSESRQFYACLWPWDNDWWKPSTPRRDLVKAAALTLAAIESIDRAAIAAAKGEV